jgi:carboxypeptidase family protein
MTRRLVLHPLLFWFVLTLSLAIGQAVDAQISTATVQGRVSDSTGVLPGVTVIARETTSGFTHETVTTADGHYTLAGLRPGTYEIRVTMDQYKPQARTVEVLVGQNVTVDFLVSPNVTYTETVQVVSERLVDTRATDVSTNVTSEQIQHLPQNSRNFMNFAALAPGLRVSDNEFRKEFSAGALPSQNVNVFIDGVSYKNDVIDGGVVGQDASRGNPFPQNAVKEFQVLTQNFKAEYEKAASAIITAVTKSGTNRYAGDIFGFYQDTDLVENEVMIRDPASQLFVKGKASPKPEYERWQWGASIGGPVIRNKAQFFASYEENRQDRANTVLVGSVSNAPSALVADLRTREGVFTSPFREKLLFSKGSWQPAQGHHVELTYSWRNETDIRGFGGTTSFEAAENVRNRVDSIQGKWQVAGSAFLNETYLSYQRYRWNPEPENEEMIGLNYSGLLRIGGRDTEQLIVQQRPSLRND